MDGYSHTHWTGLLFAPGSRMSALMRDRDSQVRNQAIAFERERGELERKATDARMPCCRPRVQPHFLFNHARQRARVGRFGFAAGSAVLNS